MSQKLTHVASTLAQSRAPSVTDRRLPWGYAEPEEDEMNLAALIGEVTSPIQLQADGDVTFSLAVIGRQGDSRQIFTVQAHGAQGEACRRYLDRGLRVAIEGRVVPGAVPAEVIADRVQFLTTRAQRDALR